MTRGEIMVLVQQEWVAPIGPPRRRTSAFKRFADCQGALMISLGWMTWHDLRTSEQADLRAAMEKAQDEAAYAFATAYVDALEGFVARHPDLPRPLPRYLRDVDLGAAPA